METSNILTQMTEKDSSTKSVTNGGAEEMSTRTLPILALNEVSYSLHNPLIRMKYGPSKLGEGIPVNWILPNPYYSLYFLHIRYLLGNLFHLECHIYLLSLTTIKHSLNPAIPE